MSEQKILHIRESIALARKNEAESNELQTYLQAQLSHLHPAIELPKHNAAEALLAFVIRYIEHVPDFLEALSDLMREAGLYEHGQIFVQIAEDFFLKPPELVSQHSGMHALIDEAYLAHRLIEEVNDRLLVVCGRPLAPMDMTLSNIIVHDLLGEEFANQLDLAVHYAIEALFQAVSLEQEDGFARYMAAHPPTNWSETLKRWPCLAGDSAISLRFDTGTSTKEVVH